MTSFKVNLFVILMHAVGEASNRTHTSLRTLTQMAYGSQQNKSNRRHSECCSATTSATLLINQYESHHFTGGP